MNFLKQNKYQLAGKIALVLVFVASVYVRRHDLKTDLGRHHEWITAHALMTMEIWDQNGGPSEFGYNPVYSYPDAFVFGRRPLGGVTDEKGQHYYVSYPPFSFILGYYACQFMGGPTLDNIRFLNLFIHFLCGLFIYLIFAEILSRSRPFVINVSGLISASIYYLSVGTLWAHGMLYFVDTVEQLFFLICILLCLKMLNSESEHPKKLYIGLFVLFFLSTYTEWLGLFSSLIAGLVFLLLFFLRKKKRYLISFLSIGTASALALGLTILQFSSIAGYDDLTDYLDKKYTERSGQESAEMPEMEFRIGDEDTQLMLQRGIDRQYIMAENLVGSVGIAFVVALLIPVCRRKMSEYKEALFVFVLLVLPVLMHYYLFYNFNALHDFSSIKAGLVMAIFIGLLVHLILSGMPNHYFQIGFTVVLGGLFILKGVQEVNRYYEKYGVSTLDQNRVRAAKLIGEHSINTVPLFTNMAYHPQYSYYAKQDYLFAADTTEFFDLLKLWNVPSGQYFHHEDGNVRFFMHVNNVQGEIELISQNAFISTQ